MGRSKWGWDTEPPLRRSSKSGVQHCLLSPLDILSHHRVFLLCLLRFIPSSWLLLLFLSVLSLACLKVHLAYWMSPNPSAVATLLWKQTRGTLSPCHLSNCWGTSTLSWSWEQTGNLWKNHRLMQNACGEHRKQRKQARKSTSKIPIMLLALHIQYQLVKLRQIFLDEETSIKLSLPPLLRPKGFVRDSTCCRQRRASYWLF